MVMAHHWIPDKNDLTTTKGLEKWRRLMHDMKTSPVWDVEEREKGGRKEMIGVAEWGGEMALVVSRPCARLSPKTSSLLYQHSGCVLQEGGLTHPGAKPKGQRILGGNACWGWVQGGHHQGCAGTLEEEGRKDRGRQRVRATFFSAVSDKKDAGTPQEVIRKPNLPNLPIISAKYFLFIFFFFLHHTQSIHPFSTSYPRSGGGGSSPSREP